MQDHESGVVALERWCPWQSVLEEVVAGCMVQLKKLDTALSDGGLSSVDDFYAVAMQLYDLANELGERCEDMMRWLSARSEADVRDET